MKRPKSKRLNSWTNFQIKEDLENKGRGIRFRFRVQDEIEREINLKINYNLEISCLLKHA